MQRGSYLFIVLLLLLGAVGVILLVEDRFQRPQAGGEGFQRLVGGLGFGPDLDLHGGAFRFDPRLQDADAQDCGPIPGGSSYGGQGAVAIFGYPSPVPTTEKE